MYRAHELRFIYWNADGVRSKQHELLDLVVSDLNVDIIAICETRLTDRINLNLPGFTCFRSGKHPSGRGQGVALFIKTNLEQSRLNTVDTQYLEVIGVRLHLCGCNYSIFSVYQSPNLTFLKKDLDLLLEVDNRVLTTGDLNAKHEF